MDHPVPTRPTLPEMYLRIARVVASRATCQRARVGCVITNEEMTTVWSIGYNGHEAGGPNRCPQPERPGQCGTIHAEVNALVKAPYDRGDLVMFCTLAPCLPCAKLIVNSAVKRLFIGEAYRDTAGVDLLRERGVEVVDLSEGA